MDSLIEAVGVFDKYAVTKGENELVITTNETKADVDEEIADMAMVGIPAGQQIITALKEGAVVEAKGAGSKITFNITPQVRTAVRKLLAIINPKIQLTKGGNLSAEELADIQTGLSTAVESPVTVARDGQSFSFESDLSASDMKQRFDAAMSSDQEGKVLLTVTGIFGAMALIGAFLNNEFVFAFGGMEMLVSAIVGFHFFLSLSPYREYIKQNRVIEERGLQGRVVTLKRPKVSDKGWASMGDDLIKALGVTGNKEFQITRDEKEIRIETSMSKVDLDKKISDMAMTTTLNPKQIGKSDKAALSTKNPWVQGGIDFNSANLNLQIKRDGRGVPLPLAQQDMAQLNSIGGFVPEILEIKPVVDFPIISELQQKLQTTSAVASVS